MEEVGVWLGRRGETAGEPSRENRPTVFISALWEEQAGSLGIQAWCPALMSDVRIRIKGNSPGRGSFLTRWMLTNSQERKWRFTRREGSARSLSSSLQFHFYGWTLQTLLETETLYLASGFEQIYGEFDGLVTFRVKSKLRLPFKRLESLSNNSGSLEMIENSRFRQKTWPWARFWALKMNSKEKIYREMNWMTFGFSALVGFFPNLWTAACVCVCVYVW